MLASSGEPSRREASEIAWAEGQPEGRGERERASANDSTLRRAARVGLHPSTPAFLFLDDRGAQPGFDEFKDHPVTHSPGHLSHQLAMWDRVKVLRKVGIDYFSLAHAQRFPDGLRRLMGVTSGPKTEGARM